MSRRKNNRKHGGGKKLDQDLSAARFRIHPKAPEVADRLDGRALLECLKKTFEQAARVSHELRECRYFSLLDEVHLDLLAETDERRQIDWFWRQMNELLVVVIRTASRAVVSTIDGLSWALGSKNELILALSARSLIEHAAALHDVELDAEFQSRLTQEIWPNQRSDSPLLCLTDQDKDAHKALLRFAVGRRVQFPAEPVPFSGDSKSKWEKFNKALKCVPPQFEAKQFMTSIDSLSKQAGHHHVRSAYELLCEYCHPNSASRTLDFNLTMTEFGKHHLTDRSKDVLSIGLRNVHGIFPLCCQAIEHSLASLSNCRKPMPAEPPGQAEPPVGGQRVVDEYGRVSWVHWSKIYAPLPEKKGAIVG
jgi:hypothetical protein